MGEELMLELRAQFDFAVQEYSAIVLIMLLISILFRKKGYYIYNGLGVVLLVFDYIAVILGINCKSPNKETDTAKSEIYSLCVGSLFAIVVIFLYFKYNQSAELGLLLFRCFVGIAGVRIVAEILIGQNSELKTKSIRVGVRLLSLMIVSVIFNGGRKLTVDIVLSLIKGVGSGVLWRGMEIRHSLYLAGMRYLCFGH